MFSGLYGDLPEAKDEQNKKQEGATPTSWAGSTLKPPVALAARNPAGFVPTTLRATPIQAPAAGRGGRGRGRGAPTPSSTTAKTSTIIEQQQQPQPTLVSASIAQDIIDEYDPAVPNDYIKVRQQREQQRFEAEAEADRQERLREMRQLEELEQQQQLEQQRAQEAAVASTAMMGIGAGIGLQQQQQQPLTVSEAAEIAANSGKPKGMSLAQKMMEQMGWKAGQGLGRNKQGIAAPLMMQKTDVNAGVIVSAAPLPSLAKQQPVAEVEQQQPLPLHEQDVGTPSTVILLRNVVGRGQVDDSLDEEIGIECSKYGEVLDVLIFEVIEPGFPSEEAVRIFVEFEQQEAAAQALNELNGRFFGGRRVRGCYFDHERFKKNKLAPLPGEL